MVSEDSVRRALKAVAEDEAERWMRQALMHSVRQLLDCKRGLKAALTQAG